MSEPTPPQDPRPTGPAGNDPAPPDPAAAPFAPPAGAPADAPQPPAYGTPAPSAPQAPVYAEPTPWAGPAAGYGTGHPQGQPPYGSAPGAPAAPPYGAPAYGAPAPRTGMAIAALVVGILSFLLAWVPFVGWLGVVGGVVAVVLGVLVVTGAARGVRGGRGMGVTGLVVGGLAVVLGLVLQVVYVSVIDQFTEEYDRQMSLSQGLEDSLEGPAAEQDAPPAEDADATDPLEDYARFGESYTYDDGIELAVGAAGPYTPSDTSAGAEGFEQFVRFDVTIVNGSDVEFDPSMVLTSMTSGGTSASEIFDSANGLEGSPMTAVLPGQTVTFPVAYAVTDPADLTLEVMLDWEHDDAVFVTAP